MRLRSGVEGRGHWYDRVTDYVTVKYLGESIAPHSAVTRGEYTVPVNSLCKISAITLYMERITRATTNARASMFAYVETTSGPTHVLSDTSSELEDIHGVVRRELSDLGVYKEGSVIKLNTLDESTGGTLNYRGYISLIIFDA